MLMPLCSARYIAVHFLALFIHSFGGVNLSEGIQVNSLPFHLGQTVLLAAVLAAIVIVSILIGMLIGYLVNKNVFMKKKGQTEEN
jgi:tetrahydromethanopterin S-methyltransferase subunit C